MAGERSSQTLQTTALVNKTYLWLVDCGQVKSVGKEPDPDLVALVDALKALQTVMADGYWVDREQVSNPVQYLRTLMQSIHDEEARRKEFGRKFGLTPRQLKIVSAVVHGYSNNEIAEYFKIPDDTVMYTLSNIFDKLGVSNRLALALFAVQRLPIYPIG